MRNRALITKGRSDAAMTDIMSAIDESDRLSVCLYKLGRCPNCGWSGFHPGPCGGLSENIQCVTCGSKWNIRLPFRPQAIANPDSVYDRTTVLDLREYFRGEPE